MSDENIQPETFDSISLRSQSVDNDDNIQISNKYQQSSQMSPWNILTNHHGISIDEKFVLKLIKGSKNVNKEVKDSCKVLHFSSEWTFEEILATIDGLDYKEYQQLFIFIIERKNLGLIGNNQEQSSTKGAKLQEKLLKFGSDQPMMIQLISEVESTTKIYYKEETLNYFTAIEHQQDESENSNAFQSFLSSFFNGNFNNSEIEILDAVREFENCSLVLRFLQTLQLSDGFFGALVLDRATNGTKAEFMAALDSPFDCNGRILGNRAQKYISDVFGDDDAENDDSVLLTAIENENVKITDYLITYWTHLIQQLPFDHQVRISTAAFETNQLDVLCDLLDIADYPFPNDFKGNQDHDRLYKIINQRVHLNAAIENENFVKINEFIHTNPNQKFIYNPSNNSALTEALNLRKIAVFYYLKSLRFQGEKCDDILAKLSKEEKEQAVKIATDQRKKNVNKSVDIAPKSVMLLSMRSSVHNSRTEKMQASKYREKILKWFIDIHKVAPELIDVAASCDYLKIIFDFESDSVENMSLTGSNASGSTYPVSKWIFVGAKLSNRNGNVTKQREQKIKGVLAHELCHYVMRLVYENQEKPYYKYKQDIKEMFEEIVERIDKWSAKDSKCPNDECNGIISSVFTLYPSNDFHPELIVRVVQVMTEFDDSEDKSNSLQEKYKTLFEFWHIHVVPELRKYLHRNIEVIRLNGTFELIPCIKNLKYELRNKNEVEKLTNNKMVVVQTNVPKLLFLNIREYLQQESGNLFDSQNIFVKPKKLKYEQHLDDFKQICSEKQELSIFVDCSKEIPDNLENIFFNMELNFIFIVSSEVKCNELSKIIKEQQIENAQELEINYNWSDLTEESQNLLLNTKINFQNNSQIKLKDLIQIDTKDREATTEDDTKVINDLIDDQLLNLILENQQAFINSRENDENSEKYFQLLFKSRNFIKKTTAADEEGKLEIKNAVEKSVSETSSLKGKEQKILEDQLLLDIKEQKYVLISDQAGNGKSWALKNFEKTLRDQNPTNWVTYVDLKQFIEEFKSQKDEPEFSSFIIENILKPNQKFEAKIFQKMYKNGKVFILFDGFDEIAPTSAEFVSKLAQNFQQNSGNQLWIATRDFFEVDLKDKLKLDVSYRLGEMTEKEGIELISRCWVLMDLKGISDPKSKEDFDKCIEKSKEFQNYQQNARQIIKNAFISRNTSVGLPQLFKMIADGFKNVNDFGNLQGPKIYVKFIKLIYKRWSEEKGQIRNEASIDSQNFELNFNRFHQYHAILSLYPELAAILYPGYDGSEWPQEEVIACGILSLKYGKIYFLHETFREYFVADAIAKALIKKEVKNEFIIILDEILNVYKFKIIRTFLFPTLNEKSVLEKFKLKIQKLILHEENIFSEFFVENLENLADFAIQVLRNESYETGQKMLDVNIESIVENTKSPKMFSKFQEFFINFLKIEDLKNVIIKQEAFQGIIKSTLEIEIFEDFVMKIEAKTDREFVRNGLMLMSSEYKGNIFSSMTQSSNINTHKVNKFLEIMEKFFTSTEMLKLISKCNTGDQNILHCAAKWCEKIEVHETLWEILLKLFENRDELTDFILQKDNWDSNSVHKLVSRNGSPEIIELTFKILRENFSDAQFQEILTSKGRWGMNLLQYAAYESKVLKIHQFCWKFFKDFYKPAENFLKMVKEVSTRRENILHVSAGHSSIEVFEFIIEELEKIASRDEIREMFRNLNGYNQNLPQSAALLNQSSKLHETLSKTFRRYFEKAEILQFIQHVDDDGYNIIVNAIKWNTVEIVKLTWNQIKSFLNHDEQIEYLKTKGRDDKNIIQISLENHLDKQEVNKWVRNQMKNYKINF